MMHQFNENYFWMKHGASRFVAWE